MQKQLELLRKYEITLSGIRGQHFLIDPNIRRKIIELVDPKPGDKILEIGPGLGALTEDLLASGAEIIAVEKDPRFCEILKSEYVDSKNLNVINSDILSFDFNRLWTKKERAKDQRIKVVGNIPYYITTPIFMLLVSNRKRIDSAVLMMQKEIVERFLAMPSSKDYGRLTILGRFYAEIKRAFDVSADCFRPRPRVKSTVITVEFHAKEPEINEVLFFEVVRHAFGERRKNILNSLSHGFKNRLEKSAVESALKSSGIPVNKRAEELLLKDYLKLAEFFNSEIRSQRPEA